MGRTPEIHVGVGSTPRKELAGAALAGAVAIGGKVAWGRLSSSRGAADEAFCLRAGESVEDGIRRIADSQLAGAQAELGGAPKRKLSEAVHDTRKRLKRLRATVRLPRGALGEDVYKRENAAFRDTGRRLAGVRDAAVLIETLDGLEEASGADLTSGATSALRTRLEAEREEALNGLRADGATVDAVVGDLEAGRARVGEWPLQTGGFGALESGLRRMYRRGRRAMRRAAADPTSENFHEWRKRVKDLWHALQILRSAAPRRMNKLANRTHKLSDLLGDDHDLAELRHYVLTHRQLFDDRLEVVGLMRAIDRRRAELHGQAIELGSSLYARRPKRFVSAIGRRWAKNAAPTTA
jgi:CHAD domain-containing protein